MADKPTSKEFGKRPQASVPPTPRPPVKRSGHVALLVMGTLAVGTTAYTLMPRQNCEPAPAGATVPGTGTPPQASTACSSRSSSSSGSSRWSSRSSFFSSDSSSHSSSDSGSGSVSRGGFGSFGHGFSGGG